MLHTSVTSIIICKVTPTNASPRRVATVKRPLGRCDVLRGNFRNLFRFAHPASALLKTTGLVPKRCGHQGCSNRIPEATQKETRDGTQKRTKWNLEEVMSPILGVASSGGCSRRGSAPPVSHRLSEVTCSGSGRAWRWVGILGGEEGPGARDVCTVSKRLRF